MEENVICIHCCSEDPLDIQKVALFPSAAAEQGNGFPFVMTITDEQMNCKSVLRIKNECGGGGGGLGGSGEGGGGSGDGGGGGGGSGEGGGGIAKAVGVGKEESSACKRPIVMPKMMPRATHMIKKISTTAFNKVDDLCC